MDRLLPSGYSINEKNRLCYQSAERSQRIEVQLIDANLSDINMDNLDLRGSNLSGANLCGISHKGTILSNPPNPPEKSALHKYFFHEPSSTDYLMSWREDAILKRTTVDPSILPKLSSQQITNTIVKFNNPVMASLVNKLVLTSGIFVAAIGKDASHYLALVTAALYSRFHNDPLTSTQWALSSIDYIATNLNCAIEIASNNTFWKSKTHASLSPKPGTVEKISDLDLKRDVNSWNDAKLLADQPPKATRDQITQKFYDAIKNDKLQTFQIDYFPNEPVDKGVIELS